MLYNHRLTAYLVNLQRYIPPYALLQNFSRLMLFSLLAVQFNLCLTQYALGLLNAFECPDVLFCRALYSLYWRCHIFNPKPTAAESQHKNVVEIHFFLC